MTALEKRLTGLANDFDTCQGESGTVLCPITADAVADLRALLVAHAKAKRELAIRRGIERELFALTEGMMNAQCPPWPKGDEPEECPSDNCSKCWRKYFDGKLKPKKEKV